MNDPIEKITHYCAKCGEPLTKAWPYALCEPCGKLPCRHGNTQGECDQCYIEGDRAYDVGKGN